MPGGPAPTDHRHPCGRASDKEVGMRRQVLGGLAVLLVLLGRTVAAPVSGHVFLDGNGDGRRQDGEAGLGGVLVSDGRIVAATAADGAYRLESAAAVPMVWVTVPRDRRPVGRFWQRATDGHADFGLVAAPQSDAFQFIQITDCHIGRADLLKQFCERVNTFPVPISFVVNTGDLVGGVDVVLPDEAPRQYAAYEQAVTGLKVPLLNVPGNHEHTSHNRKDADPQHRWYGKGLYLERFGPTYYSWDWGKLHLVALDGTRLPYAEALGPEQLAWLAEDLRHQPADKPVVLFCHQAIHHLRDRQALQQALAGHRVVAGFCGHLHSTLAAKLGDIPIYLTGALGGAWWSGPNPDGSPQGFALVQVAGDTLQQVYAGREGPWSMDARSPRSTAVQAGRVPVEVSLLDLGRDVTLTARYADAEVPLQRSERAALWSTWRGEVDTAAGPDGAGELLVTASGDGRPATLSARFIVRNGRDAPTRLTDDGLLRFQVSGVDAADEVLFNGQPLGVLTAGTPAGTWVELRVPRERLRRLNQVTFRAVAQGTRNDDFRVGPVLLKVGQQSVYDLRGPSFNTWSVGNARPEVEVYLCLP